MNNLLRFMKTQFRFRAPGPGKSPERPRDGREPQAAHQGLSEMSWHSTGRWAVDARGFTQPLTTPMDLEYSSLSQNMRNAPSWWSPQRLSLLEQPDNFSNGQIRGSMRQLESPPKPAFGIPASAGHTGILRGNFEGVVMGLRTEGRPFQPLKTPAAIMVTPSHFARFPAMTAPKLCRTRLPSRTCAHPELSTTDPDPLSCAECSCLLCAPPADSFSSRPFQQGKVFSP
jgi:hypothetical protein